MDAVASRLLVRLANVSPILAGADQLVYVDVDDTVRETHGYRKQGAAYGYSRVKGLNFVPSGHSCWKRTGKGVKLASSGTRQGSAALAI